MACNYSSKFLPLIEYNKRMLLPHDPEGFHAFIVNSFNDDPNVIYKAINMPPYVKEIKKTKEVVKVNTKQAFIVAEESNVNSAYLGRSDAYTSMINQFRKKILEFARIQINFNTGEVRSFDSNALLPNSISVLNNNIFKYKLQLIENILSKTSDANKELFGGIKIRIEQELVSDNPDISKVDNDLNLLISTVKCLSTLDESTYDDFIQLTNFDKLLTQQCPYIEIDTRYTEDGINKYKYVGSNVIHFSGWTANEFADSMDQASMLVKAVLDYIPEIDSTGKPIPNSSIGLTGFYSVMTALRNTILYHPDDNLRELRKSLRDGTKCDLGKLIDAYIKYLQSPRQLRGNVSGYYESHRTYLIGKLEGIKKCIFNSNLDGELKDIFNNMFFKNVQMNYVAYTFDEESNDFAGKDLKNSMINTQLYTLTGAMSSSIYNLRRTSGLYDSMINDRDYNNKPVKYKVIDTKNPNIYEINYNGKYFRLSKNNKTVNTNFGLQEFKDIFYDVFQYIIPEDYETVGKQINGNNWKIENDLKDILAIGIKCIHRWGGGFTYQNDFPTNLNDNYKEFAKVAKVISTIYGSDIVNVVKNVNKKKNLPLYGLTSLAHNFHFVMWDHMDVNSEKNIYSDSFFFDQYDNNGNLIRESLIREPKVRSEVYYNGELKPSTKLTVPEVFKLSFLQDYYQNFLKGDHIYLQNATFADKGTHFLVNYDLNTKIYGDKTLKELIEEHMESDPNSSGLFNLMLDTRRKRITKLVNNIITDYNAVFENENFKSLDDIQNFLTKGKYNQEKVRAKFRSKGVNFYEEIHLSKGKINETILEYSKAFANEESLKNRLNAARKAFVQDLKTNRVFLNTALNGTTKSLGENYKDWVGDNSEIKLFEENGDKVILHPVLEAYFMTNDLLSNEYNEIMIGGVYAHSKDTESGRLIAQIKRSVIYGATMHSFAQGMKNGVAEEVKIACMPDIKAIVTNILGTTKDDQDSMDGAGLSTPLQARLESNSLLDARVGYDKKSIGHDIDSEYGRPSLLKWAVYALTNARRRIAFRSTVSQETLLRKMYSAETIGLTLSDVNKLLKQLGDVYYKDTDNTGKYYKIISFDEQNGEWIRSKQEVDIHGNVVGEVSYDYIANTDTLWDIDQLFGGAWSMSMIDGSLDYAEANVDALEAYVTEHQKAKTAQIGYLVNKSAMKVGVGNLNTDVSWTDNSKLDYITMSTRYLGVQMDAEHELEDSDVTEMTQMISAISSHGYTSDIANRVYKDIGNVILEALADYDAAIKNDDPKEIYKLLGEAFVKSFENNDRDTLGLAQAFVLKASKALKEGNYEFRLPFSAETVNGIFISTVSSLLTKKGIRRKYEGFAGVLTPSHDMIQYYNIGGTNMMYEQFADKVREMGIQSLYDKNGRVVKTAVQRAVEDLVINGERNPFLIPIDPSEVDFEDTVVVFETDDSGKILHIEPKTYYIKDFGQYDDFKSLDFKNKKVYNFTSRPKNLKGTNTKFKVNGLQKTIYDLDSVRAAYYYEQGTNPEFVTAVLNLYGYTNVSKLNVSKVFQKIIQSNLRSLKKGLPIRTIQLIDGVYVPSEFTATDVYVAPAQIVTGRFHAKEFMLEPTDKFSDIKEQKSEFFYRKLINKYGFDSTEPDWTERVLFATNGEKYLVTTDDKTKLELKGYVKDNSIQKFGNTFYYGDVKIGTFENVEFYTYNDNGKVRKVIATSPESKEDLNKSVFFEMWRDNYTDDRMNRENKTFHERMRVRAQRMWQSFELQCKMLGTRIPTQDMQSFMPEEIIGWTDSTVNDLYVPVQMFVIKGNDLDIDKEYELSYGIDNQGLVYINTKLVNELEYSYNDLFRLLPPNGIEYTTTGTVDNDTFPISHYDLMGDKIDLINKIIESKATKVSFDVLDEDALKFLSHLNLHTTTQLSDKVVDMAIKNQVVTNILKVSTDVENQVISQISVDTVTKPIKEAAKRSSLATYEKTINSDNPLVMYTMQVQNMVGREVIGITAVALKQFFAKTTYYNTRINEFINDLPNATDIQGLTQSLVKDLVKYNPLRKTYTVFANVNLLDAIDAIWRLGTKIPSASGFIPYIGIDIKIGDIRFTNLYDLLIWMQEQADMNDSSLNQSGILSEATDNAKSLTLSKINATQSFVDIYTYMAALGEDMEYVADIMISPAFTYITKLVDGDMFEGDSLSVKNAIKFYLGNYIFEGTDNNSITTIASQIDVDRNDLRWYDEALKVCYRIKQTSYKADDIESAQDYYIDALSQNPDVPKPEPLIKGEVDTLIRYFKECKIRDKFIEQNGHRDDARIKMILEEIIPGVEEQGILGALCGLNQGLRTRSFDKIKFTQRIENYFNRILNDALKVSRKETAQHAEIRLKVSEILGKDITFDLFKFATDNDYQQKMVSAMEYLYHTDNILKIITTVPHFKQMLHTWAVDETLIRKASVRYNLEKDLMQKVKPEGRQYSFNEQEHTQIKRYVNDMLILNWLFQEDLSINIPTDQKIYNITGNDDYSLDGKLRLNDVHALASFKRLVETYIIPTLKQRDDLKDNAFLNALTVTSENSKSGIKSYLKLPVPMMDIEKSVELEAAYNSYINAFDEISTINFGGMKLGDIFYLYNLIVNKDSFGQNSLTRLFENLVNSNKGSFLVNSFNEWIGDLDRSGDYSAIKINLIDLTGRISKYATGTSIRQPLNTMYNSDYTFEVPNFAKTWKPLRKIQEIFGRKSDDSREVDLKNGTSPYYATWRGYGEDYNFIGDITVITEDDWEESIYSKEDWNDLNELEQNKVLYDYEDDPVTLMFKDFSREELEYLRKQRAFIHNGKIYINAEKGDYTDALHEWTHYILASMKWSENTDVRERYYKIVSLVSNHPRFNIIAEKYPWAHGSDLQEEVLVNLMQMWMQNKVFADDNVIEKFMDMSEIDSGLGEVFRMILNGELPGDLNLNEALQILKSEDFDVEVANNYILKKHQKIMQLKDKLIEEEYLKMICK